MWWRALLWLGLLGLVNTSLPPGQQQQELTELFEHLAHIAEFKCQVPQERLIPVTQLIPEAQSSGKAYFPEATVLHRCDDASGCCPTGHRCSPAHSNAVQSPFKVTYLEDNEKHKKGSWAMEFLSLDNHTRCICSELPRQLTLDYRDNLPILSPLLPLSSSLSSPLSRPLASSLNNPLITSRSSPLTRPQTKHFILY